MKWTGLNELRESFLAFFEQHGHVRLPSAPLIPQGDNSVLLINAGMTPLKKYFQGTEKLPGNRATSCQKCIRTPDIENVGKTERHGTYFEMLGNFSFGDYFKKGAARYAWDYLTKTLELPADRLWITIFEEDDEAGDIWRDQIGVPRERIVKLGRADNFWEHGSGPCGPCSEIHFDRGPEKGCGKPDCTFGCECGRYVEIWNLVFTQYDSDGKGNYAQLKAKNIDTGMGLERLACVVQEVDNLFEVNTIRNILNKACELTGKTYKADADADISLRIITDHTRGASFMTCDGVLPSNEGRGYVLRRLLRRASRHGRLLGMTEPFLYKICDTIVDENAAAYPELEEKRAYIKTVIKTEEENFQRTIESGLKILTEFLQKLPEKGILSGENTFKLHDTYGFPVDLTREILEESGRGVDEDGFAELMQLQRAAARASRRFKGGWDEHSGEESGFVTRFVGYDNNLLTFETELLFISEPDAGGAVRVILAETPFYAESGGQASDIGFIDGKNGRLRVTSVSKSAAGQIVHFAIIESGTFILEEKVTAKVDVARRAATRRNHSAAHLLQAALRSVLGEHVHQAGQLVDAEKCRFDFTHFAALSADELARIELLVNEKILEALPVLTEEMPIEAARERGAMALFGEKYGDTVRVVTVPDFSAEFCGGTHVAGTAEIGLFRIVNAASVASGVRRVEAVTGFGVLAALSAAEETIVAVAKTLGVGVAAVTEKAKAIMQESADNIAKINSLNGRIAAAQLEKVTECVQIGEISLIKAVLEGFSGDALRTAGDNFALGDSAVLLLAGVDGDKGNFLCRCGKTAIAHGLKAGAIVKLAASATGGNGGGRPDSAMGGIADVLKVELGFKAAEEIIQSVIK